MSGSRPHQIRFAHLDVFFLQPEPRQRVNSGQIWDGLQHGDATNRWQLSVPLAGDETSMFVVPLVGGSRVVFVRSGYIYIYIYNHLYVTYIALHCQYIRLHNITFNYMTLRCMYQAINQSKNQYIYINQSINQSMAVFVYVCIYLYIYLVCLSIYLAI